MHVVIARWNRFLFLFVLVYFICVPISKLLDGNRNRWKSDVRWCVSGCEWAELIESRKNAHTRANYLLILSSWNARPRIHYTNIVASSFMACAIGCSQVVGVHSFSLLTPIGGTYNTTFIQSCSRPGSEKKEQQQQQSRWNGNQGKSCRMWTSTGNGGGDDGRGGDWRRRQHKAASSAALQSNQHHQREFDPICFSSIFALNV